jgi:hypothetical protein
VNDRNLSYIDKLKEEIKNLNDQINKNHKEKEEIREKVSSRLIKLKYIEQVSNEGIEREKHEKEKIISKNLVLENQIIKKDNQITIYKKKIDKFYEKDEYNIINVEKEIYVSDPNSAVVKINDELLCYKEAYDKLTKQLSENKANLNKYEKIVSEQQLEITKLRELLKEFRSLSPNTITNPNKDELKTPNLKITNLDDHTNSPNSNLKPKDSIPSKNTLIKKSFHKSNGSGNAIMTLPTEENKRIKTQSFESEEWLEILKMINITPEEIDRFSKNKMLCKIIDAIEILNKLLIDKNLQIRLLENENQLLNKKDTELNRENMRLIKKCEDLLQQISNSKNRKTIDKKNPDSSQSDISSVIS